MTTEEQLWDLVDAVDLVLDDMGEDGQSCCLYAKALLRVAFEPFRSEHDISDERFIMPLIDAHKVLDEVDR